MSKNLVAYFSASGITAKAAKKLAQAANADIYEICPAVPYTDADLNWMNKDSRSSVEMNQPDFRPEIAGKVQAMEQYDTVFVGFPIWWYIAPTIINTFLESYDFSGKKIVLFATSGGSGMGNTAKNLRSSVSADATIIEGKVWSSNASAEELSQWIHGLGISGVE